MKHVFLFQVHKEPELLRRILSRLSSENHYFYINIDKKVKDIRPFRECLAGIGNIREITRMNVMHGGFSQVACAVMQMQKSMADPQKYDYFHTMSGQDYPCVSMKTFDQFFENNTKSYMMLDTQEQADEWKKKKYPGRTDHWYVMDIFNKRWMHAHHFYGIVRRIAYLIPREKYDQNLLWGGWNWFSLSRKTAGYILDYCHDHTKFVERFKYTACCDELVFPSIVHPNAEELQIMGRNSLHYVDWKPSRPTNSLPLVLDERDYDSIVKSGMFFCRKVELPQSEELLDMLDRNALTGS